MHEPHEAPTVIDIGDRIRNKRKALGLTLQEVAHKTGLSVGFLSLLERGQSSPSLVSLGKIAQVLGLPLSALVDSPGAQHEVHQQGDQRFGLRPGALDYERISSIFSGSVMHAVRIYIPPAYCSETVSHAGEELIFVLRGKIEYRVGSRLYRLGAGDSLHFDAAIRHRVKTVGGDAELLWVGTLDVFGSGANTQDASALQLAKLAGTEFSGMA